MPKVKKNAKYLEWLEDMRDEEDSGSNKYMILNKALNSLKKETEEYPNPDSLIAVKFIGPKIISDLKKRWKDAGGMAAGGELTSNPPSPNKRKRVSGASSTSGSQSRNRPPQQPSFEPASDDEDVLPVPKRRTGQAPTRDVHSINSHMNPQLAFSAPQIPLGIHSTHPHHVANPRPWPAPSEASHQTYSSHPHIYQQAPRPVPQNLASSGPAPPQPQPMQPFKFSYIDAEGKQVLSRDMAAVDIEAGALWYKLVFFDSADLKTHLLRQRVRLDPYDNRKGKQREELVQAWVRDEDVEQFVLHTAPGLVAPGNNIDIRKVAGTALESGSQNGSYSQMYEAGRKTAENKTSEMFKASRDSLEDLLNAEKKNKRKTIDPARVTDMEKEWEVRKSGIISSSSNGVKKEEIRTHPDVLPQDFTRQRMAVVAMARQQSSSIVAGPSFSSSYQIQLSLTSTTNSAHTSTFPEYSRDSNASQSIPHAPPSDFGLPQFSAPIIPKQKLKGRVRGRVSEFAPALPAVDEFDVDLDNQAASQHMRADKITPTSVSHASADLIDDVTDLTTAAIAPSFPQFDPIVFPRGSFDVILVLDNREIKSHKHRDYIATELRKRNVNVVQRSLTLGDVLWIARRRVPVAGAEDECVLNYILERKRLDDLCGSIKDGRFREQKFRLANTGLKVFYLIEEYDLEKNREVFGVQIDTARSSTQIIDGFIVKETKKLSYTIDFLATMHDTIAKEYQNEPLYMIPQHIIKRHSYLALQKHLRNSQLTMQYLTSYACFEKLNSKSGNLTTRDLFAQMLLCVKGVSAEKASAIIGVYPTMRSLWDAFRIAEVDELEGITLQEREGAAAEQGKKVKGRKKKSNVPQAKAMLCDIEATGRQRIGPTLSENIYRLMRANSYQE